MNQVARRGVRSRQKIIHQLGPIDGLLQNLAVCIIPGIAADRGQPVRGQRHEPGLRHPPGDILDIGVEAAVFVDHQHGGDFPGRLGGFHQITLYRAVAVGGAIGCETRLDIRVIERDLLGHRVVGLEHVEQGDGTNPANRILARTVEKLAFGDHAMRVKVIEIEQFLIEILRCQSCHGLAFRSAYLPAGGRLS